MAVTVSPLNLLLDDENPRFIFITRRGQADIRRYLATYEDVCQLAEDINHYGSLLPGERIVVLQRDDRYVVVEGNRRTCALQMLLSRELIPDGFAHKIPATAQQIITGCQSIEVDVLPNRESAIELMSKRHIQGVKQWRPLAKKRFFASNYLAGRSVENLSRITDIRQGEIQQDIRDYKFFLRTYTRYCQTHPNFDRDIIDLDISPFLRMFSAKFYFHSESKIKPVDILRMTYDNEYNVLSGLGETVFNTVSELVFEQTVITGDLTTRNVLTDVSGIIPILEAAIRNPEDENTPDEHGNDDTDTIEEGADTETHNDNATENNGTDNGDGPGGPPPGGPPPRTFFETIRWSGKLRPTEPEHEGLLVAINELFRLSCINCGRQRAYNTFPVATGMILRTVYEQVLKLRLIQVNLWGVYCSTIPAGSFPTLSGMENFINRGTNKATVFPNRAMVGAFNRIIAAAHREFLNANIHSPDNIRVTNDSLMGIAAGGMFSLIQSIIDLLP